NPTIFSAQNVALTAEERGVIADLASSIDPAKGASAENIAVVRAILTKLGYDVKDEDPNKIGIKLAHGLMEFALVNLPPFKDDPKMHPSGGAAAMMAMASIPASGDDRLRAMYERRVPAGGVPVVTAALSKEPHLRRPVRTIET